MKSKKLISLLLIIGLIVGSLLTTNSVQAEDSNEKYSIEYLLRNYNAVTLGQKTNNNIDFFNNSNNYYSIAGKGNIEDVSNIEGAVLAQGNYISQNNATFGSKAGSIKSFIKGTKGSNVTTSSELATDSNFVDFEKMYVQIVNEQQMLIDKTKEHIMGPNIEITSPGVYTINNLALQENEMDAENNNSTYSGPNRLFIKNYDKNKLYVFNSYDEYPQINQLLNIILMEKNSPNSTTLNELINTGNYTGNIIFNFPKAKLVMLGGYSGGTHIVAPKADAIISSYHNGTVIANSIKGNNYDTPIIKANYNIEESLLEKTGDSYLDEYKDYDDDKYSGSYSLSELLQNYSIVTLGKKSLDSKTKLAQNGQNTGSLKIFHVTGPVLINGDLYSNISEVSNYNNDTFQQAEPIIFDLESNTVTESFIRGNAFATLHSSNGQTYRQPRIDIQIWDNMTQSRNYYYTRKNIMFLGNSNFNSNNYGYYYANSHVISTDNYINFDRLYDKVVAQQKEIEEGSKTSIDNGVAHIKVGGNYVIDDINSLNEIVFDNFDENKDKLTIITVKNSGDINFPLVSRDTGSYKGIVTNDYYDKKDVTHPYEINNLVQDSYHGNIVWNIPNATYIKLKENAPFAGHLVAPKADVESPELHFSGCFIVNSLYAEGNTEAHFYPITSFSTYDTPEYDNLSLTMKNRLNSRRLGSLLGAKAIEDEIEVKGNEEAFREDKATIENLIAKEKNSNVENIVELLTNPKTYQNLGIIIIFGIVVGVSLLYTRKKERKG